MKIKFLVSSVSLLLGVFLTVNVLAQDLQMQNDEVDGDIIAHLAMININEINAADVALKKAQDPKVKEYAKMVKIEHNQNLNATKELAKSQRISVRNTETTEKLKAQSKKDIEALKKLSGKDFDKAYMDLVIKAHNEALNSLDSMLKDVKNEELKAHLEATRKHVAQHLEQAQIVQNNITA